MYEVSSTTVKLVTRINYTDRKYTVNLRKTKSINALSHSHIFKKGNKIRVVVTNLDTAPPDDVKFLATNPQVLPVLKSGSHKLYLSSNCYLSIPVQTIPVFAADNNIKNSDVKNNNTVSKDFKFGLLKNYPNPFNPSTVIEYSISQNSFVNLKVFDLTGKEIATLVNGQLSPGNYTVNFNSNTYNLSSGIYFYRLVTANQVDVGKMFLLK